MRKSVKPDEIDNTLTYLESLDSENQTSALEGYSVDTLEKLAVRIMDNKYNPRKEQLRDLGLNILRCRGNIDEFQRTDTTRAEDAKKKEQLTIIFKNAYDYALNVAKELERNIQNTDPFIQDYEIYIKIKPHIRDKSGDKTPSVASMLSESDYAPINYRIGHSLFDSIVDDIPMPLDESIQRDFYYYAFTKHGWSSNDFLNIDSARVTIEVQHQNFVEDI
jgi:hypothetical protein